MATTTFVDYTTPAVDAAWLNDVNDTVYEAQSAISGSTNRTARSKFADFVSVKDFGAVGDGVTDDLSALNTAIAYEQTNKKGLIFPAGTYKVSGTLNFLGSALRDLTFLAIGKVIIYCTGSGPVATLDSGTTTSRSDNIYFDGFILKGNASSTYGLMTSGLCRSHVRARAFDVATAGFQTKWSVLTNHHFTVSSNIDTFTVTPGIGLIVTQSTAGYYSADNKYHVIMEASISNIGVDYEYGGLGNIFTGTCENIPRGFRQQSTAGEAILSGMDFESNTVYDILASGRGLQVVGCDCSSACSSPNISLASTCSDFSASRGFIRQIDIDSAAVGTTINDIALSDNGSLGITGTGSTLWRGVGNIKVNTSRVLTSEVNDQIGSSGSYTVSLTGCTTVPASSVRYRKYNDTVVLDIPSITGTSNTTAATLTGMPTAIRPSATRSCVGVITDNSGNNFGRFEIDSGGVITLRNGASAVFTSSGTKGAQTCTITYII